MAEEKLNELIRYCKSRSGGALRGAFTYTKDDGEILYAREDIREAYRSGGFEQLRNAAWAVHTTVLAEEPHVQTLGKYRVTVHTFEEAFVMQFRKSPNEGVAVIFDRDVGRNLHKFLLECENYLE